MALPALRRRALRALGSVLRKWSDRLLRATGAETPSPPPQPASLHDARPGGPPAHWLARARRPVPPAHWLARVRQARTELGSAAQFAGSAAGPGRAYAPEPAPSAPEAMVRAIPPSAPEEQAPPETLPASRHEAPPAGPTRRRPEQPGNQRRTAPVARPAILILPRATRAQPREATQMSPSVPPPHSEEGGAGSSPGAATDQTSQPSTPSPQPLAPPAAILRLRRALPEIPRPAQAHAEEEKEPEAVLARAARRVQQPGESPHLRDARAAGPAAATEPPLAESHSGAPRLAPPVPQVPPQSGDAVHASPTRQDHVPVSPGESAAAARTTLRPVQAWPVLPARESAGDQAVRYAGPAPAEDREGARRRVARARRARPAAAGRWPRLADGPRPGAEEQLLESLRVQARLERLDREQRGG